MDPDSDPDADPDPAIFIIDLQDPNKNFCFLLLHHFSMLKSPKKVRKQWESSFSYYFCMQCSGSGSKPLTGGSGSGRPKNMWIRIRIRIRIRNTVCNNHLVLLNLPLRQLDEIEGVNSSSLMKKAVDTYI
jgi:hypothetical protein